MPSDATHLGHGYVADPLDASLDSAITQKQKQCCRCEELQGNTLDGAAVESGGAAIEVLVCALLDYNRQI